jgi:cytochrome c peroxidase
LRLIGGARIEGVKRTGREPSLRPSATTMSKEQSQTSLRVALAEAWITLRSARAVTAERPLRLSKARYRPLFEQVWGAGSFDISWPANTAQICSTPNGASQFGGSATPVHLSPEDRTRSNTVYNEWGLSIDSFEQSVAVSAFSSKFDAFLVGKYTMTADEAAGYALFRGKGNCNSCHLDGRSTASHGTEDTGTAASVRPLFTCFGSANLGLPKNPSVAFYSETTPDGVGLTPNPEGFAFTDNGLGAFLRSGFGSAPNPNATWRQFAAASDGKMQTSTARNVRRLNRRITIWPSSSGRATIPGARTSTSAS